MNSQKSTKLYKQKAIIKSSHTLLDEEEISNKLKESSVLASKLKSSTEIKAFPYLLNDKKIRRDFDRNFEIDQKDDMLWFFKDYGEPIDSINRLNIYAADDFDDGRQYAVFDKPSVGRSSRCVFYMHFRPATSRNGLFNPAAIGYYPSNIWRSKDSARLGNKFSLKMLYLAFDDLADLDFLVSDYEQTSVFTERFREFLSSILTNYHNKVYVGLSLNKKQPICIPITSTQELNIAMNLISKGGKHTEYAYKSIFVLGNGAKLKNVVTRKTKVVDFDKAIEKELFTKDKLDPKLEKALENDEYVD